MSTLDGCIQVQANYIRNTIFGDIPTEDFDILVACNLQLGWASIN